MKKSLRALFAFAALALACSGCGIKKDLSISKEQPNVLFIVVDDLRPQLGCYGDQIVQSPNIDQLAKTGVLFSRAYCQQAVCAPSRSSVMTGKRPNTIKVWDLKTHFRESLPDVVTLPQYFKNNGYHTQSIGKIYHDPASAQDAPSWSVPEILAITKREGKYILPSNRNSGSAKAAATEMADEPDQSYIDGQVADQALKVLREIKNKPFFLAVGFRRPHLPFSAPKKYWDLYDREKIVAQPAPHAIPKNVPTYAAHHNEELKGYSDIGSNDTISAAKKAELLHGYYAAISFTDAQIGKVLEELDRLQLSKNTIIVLWSDHGFHLGEKGLWAKSTNYELDTRVPLIVSAPGKAQGLIANGLVELVDLYPTLTELAGLKIPETLEGASLVPLLDKPGQIGKNAAFSQFPRPWQYKGKPKIMGYAMRTDYYRYVEWHDFNTDEIKSVELYDHRVDPAELMNIADLPANQTLLKDLREKLTAGYKSINRIPNLN